MELQLKQRLLGSIAIVSLVVIFLPAILDGDGYRHLSSLNATDQARSSGLSIRQQIPETVEHEPRMVVTQRQIDIKDLPSAKNWFVHVADRSSIDGASSLVQALGDGDYKATYRMVVANGEQVFKVEVSAGQSEAEGKEIAASIRKEYGFRTTLVQR